MLLCNFSLKENWPLTTDKTFVLMANQRDDKISCRMLSRGIIPLLLTIVLKGYSLNTNHLAIMVPAVRLAISEEGRRPSGGQQIPNEEPSGGCVGQPRRPGWQGYRNWSRWTKKAVLTPPPLFTTTVKLGRCILRHDGFPWDCCNANGSRV